MRLALLDRPLPDPAQRLQLACTPDQRQHRETALAGRVGRAQRQPRSQRLELPLGDDRRGRLVGDCAVGGGVCLLTDEDPVDRCRRLETRGRVDDVARDHRLAELRPVVERHERLAGIDRDPQLEIKVLVALVHLPNGVAHRERRAHRALCVVAERRRRTEDRHHRVADELLDDPAERLDLPPDARVVRGQDRPHVLRVQLLGPAR